ncbi:nucleoside kinase [Phocaeicola barnesiae]|uniref:Nucleoside kinase n=1 Tax=Phocaeicola barnesiae TaxID=376804 RepID=A0AAW5N5Q6_9BACT|nr:nucleoside kinase [Phocaeicola barnesiae]MCF2597818.1 nucleoside kinase [Phocaeicola barnesiae]MCR8874562.1 nucleoside kinase [Phocaeicola barnesiae]MDM8232129.1 nucleoside kinase [Phocaeicola barnesiae]MDM8241773.1 nucleoside kinase [Phocaeicola barnesiae]MDM8250591.1 nucleoside kinase [Phocaeicola barnesiae]
MTFMLQIYCKNKNLSKEFEEGTSLFEIYQGFDLNMPYGPVSARVNNKVEDLNFKVYYNKDVEFLDITSASGMRTYVRSLCFILTKAVSELYPNGNILLEHPVSKGYFCKLCIDRTIGLDDVIRIKQRMQEIIKADLPFIRHEKHTDEIIRLFKERGMDDKVKLLETSGQLYSCYQQLGDTIDSYYGSLVPSTGYIRLFDIVKYYDGLLLRIPNRKNPDKLEEVVKQEKMLDVFQEYHRWNEILGISTVGDLNQACNRGMATDLINVSEALQEKKIVRIADEITNRNENGQRVKLVLISGPSSSGKTTFSKRLSIQLMTNGLRPYPISLDDYFVNREDTPLDENGQHDFESLYALDLPFFEAQLKALLAGEEVELPRFNFNIGKREPSGKKLRIDDNMILILEGIHALNPALTPNIPAANKYKIYVSALTTILLDNHNYIPTTDNRLLRRIIRDYKYRSHSAEATINRWPSVRAGEEKWIFPYQEYADAMFNSALIFELAVLKDHVEPVLRKVPNNSPAYSEAHRLLRFLSHFVPVQDEELPPTSLLREFLGGSSFVY